MYPAAERIVLVMDNLNTHTPASLYEAFPADKAKRIAERLEIHYTPKHGSRLDMAEIELGILGRQCLDRRIDNAVALTREVRERLVENNRVQKRLPQDRFPLSAQNTKRIVHNCVKVGVSSAMSATRYRGHTPLFYATGTGVLVTPICVNTSSYCRAR